MAAMRGRAASGFSVCGCGTGLLEDFEDHALEFGAFEADGAALMARVRGPKGSASKPLRSSSSAIVGEGDHLLGKQIDEQRHEEALALDVLSVALAEDFFEEDALVGDVLVDDPEAFFVGGEDEGVAELAQRLEGGEGVEGGGRLTSVRPRRANTGRAGDSGIGKRWFGAGVAVGGGGGRDG